MPPEIDRRNTTSVRALIACIIVGLVIIIGINNAPPADFQFHASVNGKDVRIRYRYDAHNSRKVDVAELPHRVTNNYYTQYCEEHTLMTLREATPQGLSPDGSEYIRQAQVYAPECLDKKLRQGDESFEATSPMPPTTPEEKMPHGWHPPLAT
jgi:hypothetical protein